MSGQSKCETGRTKRKSKKQGTEKAKAAKNDEKQKTCIVGAHVFQRMGTTTCSEYLLLTPSRLKELGLASYGKDPVP